MAALEDDLGLMEGRSAVDEVTFTLDIPESISNRQKKGFTHTQ